MCGNKNKLISPSRIHVSVHRTIHVIGSSSSSLLSSSRLNKKKIEKKKKTRLFNHAERHSVVAKQKEQNKTKQNKIKQNKTKQNKTKATPITNKNKQDESKTKISNKQRKGRHNSKVSRRSWGPEQRAQERIGADLRRVQPVQPEREAAPEQWPPVCSRPSAAPDRENAF